MEKPVTGTFSRCGPASYTTRGPRLLFFSGGSALRETSRRLIRHTRDSVHVITPFDSGGSSAVLRRAFDMPAVGDIRNRLMALADLEEPGVRELYALFTCRFSRREPGPALRVELERMACGEHVLAALVPEPVRGRVTGWLADFLAAMPEGFDLRGASVGNLALTARWLAHGRRLGPAIDEVSRLVGAGGLVRPVVEGDLHLAAELEDGSVVTGQHRLTGKEGAPVASPVRRIWLTGSPDDALPLSAAIDGEVAGLVSGADLICYPVGSFFTSVLANLLPAGVGRAVAACPGPKVFVPNPGGDPELLGHTVAGQVGLLRRVLAADGGEDGNDPAVAGRLLDYILVDGGADYPGGVDKAALAASGLRVVDRPLLGREPGRFDPDLLAEALLALV
ncbi:GAK system CofD-like protein [Pseudodesulfovibrio sp. F-1]|uniref:GAK system CofD-like protein n=1 Tax=Pseudodesulfovibrio alkaliphilus TaxID=2661613 RepID=A0A7K1KP95_9BACT|nr:GAK system CofD-like protein [Pseudodesulfovibrio alkaliphilus]MUM77914.1 GAK system CofD-like protein [Pseudodesulfovibrio alkaliphilus]